MEDLFDTYDTPEEEVWGSDDYDQLKRDYKYHPRTSTESLRWLARFTAVYDSPYLSDHLEEASKWWADGLNYKPDLEQLQFAINQTGMPAELENERGELQHSSHHYERTNEDYDYFLSGSEWDDEGGSWSKYEEHGLYHMLNYDENTSLERIVRKTFKDTKDMELREWLGAYEGTAEVREWAMNIRGAHFRKNHSERQEKARWRGMEEYEAVAKADEKLREGLTRRKDTSGAKPLPNIDNLRVTFDVRDGVLVRRSLNKPVTGRQVKILGEKYMTDRIAYAVINGMDPADKMVRDGVATNYRKAAGHVCRDGMLWKAVVKLDGEAVTVGTYRSDRQAKEACRLYLASLDMGIL